MAKQKRSDDWGFPRWRSYGDKGREAARVRLCDREGCSEIGDRPAPKAPNSPERWYFCEAHAAEYNKNWNYFAASLPKKRRRAAEEERGRVSASLRSAWEGRATAVAAGTRCARSMRSSWKAMPTSRRSKLRIGGWSRNAPDANPGDGSGQALQAGQAAYDVLKKPKRKNDRSDPHSRRQPPGPGAFAAPLVARVRNAPLVPLAAFRAIPVRRPGRVPDFDSHRRVKSVSRSLPRCDRRHVPDESQRSLSAGRPRAERER